MALTLLGRHNLGGAPYDPAMQDEGVLIYRSSSTDVRKAVYGSSDVALGTVLNPGTRGLPYFGSAEIFGDYYYPPFRQDPYANPFISAIHTTTGVLTEFSTGLANWGSYQMRAHVFRNSGKTAQFSLASGAGNNCSDIWGNTPPIAAIFVPGNSPTGDMTNSMPATTPSIIAGGNELVLIFEDRVTVDATISYHQAYMYSWNGANIAFTQIPRFSYVYFNKGNTGPTMSPVDSGWPSRMMVADDKLWFFQKRSDSTSIWITQMNMADLPNTGYANQTWTLTNIGVGTIGTSNPAVMAFHIDQAFKKIYTINPLAASSGSFPRPNDIYDAFLPWTSPQQTVLPDPGNTTNALITGIWSFPPYVYVTKLAGVTYGNQLLKFYDPDLDASLNQRFPSGGGKDEEAYIMSILR